MARIMVVEDEPAVAQAIGDILEHGDHEVLYARPGRDAAADAVDRRYDLLITDIVMPEVSGWEIIKRVRRERPATPIIAISGGGHIMDPDVALRLSSRLGAHATLQKPIDVDSLLHAVDHALGRGSA
jgi:DNA-binding response OmpR family regulator